MHKIHPVPHIGRSTKVPPVVPWSLGDRDAPWDNQLCTESSRCQTVADTHESLQFCLERLGDREAPWQNEVCARFTHSHTPVDTPESLRSCVGCLGDRDAPCENEVCTGSSYSHTAADTPESLRLALAVYVIGAPRGRTRHTQGVAAPTQRHMHPRPSGPAREAWGIGTSRGRTK